MCPDYDLAKAARSIAFGKFINAGQTCIAPDYALVPKGKESAFADAVMAQVRKSYPTIAGNDDYSAIIAERHRRRLAVQQPEEQPAERAVARDAVGGDVDARPA